MQINESSLKGLTPEELVELLKDRSDLTDEQVGLLKAELKARGLDALKLGTAPDPNVLEQTQPLEAIKKKRLAYLVVLCIMLVTSVAAGFTRSSDFYRLNFLVAIVFVALLSSAVKSSTGHSFRSLLFMYLVILFVPIVSLIFVILIDRDVSNYIKTRDEGGAG